MTTVEGPVPVGQVLPGVVAEVLRRAGDAAGFAAWQRQVAGTGFCSCPIRLRGSTGTVDPASGEVVPLFSSDAEPDGTILVACGNRRASRCPSCSRTYASDTWHLLAAGLRGGKGVPDSVATHPRVFVTLTAPSFGPVHAHRASHGARTGRCRPRRGGKSCPHRVPLACRLRHSADDPAVGEPLCHDCFDYPAMVLWNALLPRLWRRTTVMMRRALAHQLGLSERELRRQVRLSFAKVAEFQHRGAVHLHVIVRADGVDPDDPDRRLPPPPAVTGQALADAVAAALPRATLPSPAPDQLPTVAWGDQADVAVLPSGGTSVAHRIAAYVAKYATKAAEALGLVDRKITRDDVASLTVTEHVRRILGACFDLGARPELRDLRLPQWAHMLGFGGHFSTRSRRYSVTLGSLREARAAWRRRADPMPPSAGSAGPAERAGIGQRVGSWQFVGSGYRTLGDAWLAGSAAAAARDARDDRHRQRTNNRPPGAVLGDLGPPGPPCSPEPNIPPGRDLRGPETTTWKET